MIKSVIFDLDGTLFNSIEDIADANNLMLRDHGYPEHSMDKYISWIGNGAMKLVISSLPGNAKMDEDSLNDYLISYEEIYSNNLNNKSKIYDGIEEVLNFLSGQAIPFSINTNKPQKHTKLIVENCFRNWQFENVIGQGHEYPKKPNPAAALHIAEKLGINPENILFVGDSMVDVETARRAGMITLAVSWGYGKIGKAESFDNVSIIDKPQQIIEFIKSKSILI